ncbi:hypothetical protein [Marasmitruncus massiliensis]|uniref:hypothetical protein n=1 Tax=Marasmitruncus massiliensis TaxID=1944642 RepID=UPI0011AF9331|nr:hypothetical protein [Marasmitruncus massiliensis]
MVALLYQLAICFIVLLLLLWDWRKNKNVLKNGRIYTATVVGHKSLYRFPVVQFYVKDSLIEQTVTCGLTFKRIPCGKSLDVYYWEKIPDIVIVENSHA